MIKRQITTTQCCEKKISWSRSKLRNFWLTDNLVFIFSEREIKKVAMTWQQEGVVILKSQFLIEWFWQRIHDPEKNERFPKKFSPLTKFYICRILLVPFIFNFSFFTWFSHGHSLKKKEVGSKASKIILKSHKSTIKSHGIFCESAWQKYWTGK